MKNGTLILLFGLLLAGAFGIYRLTRPGAPTVPPEETVATASLPEAATCGTDEACAPPSAKPRAQPTLSKPNQKAALSSLSDDHSGKSEPWVAQFHDLMREGRADAAIEHLNRILEADPRNEKALLELARVHAHYKGDMKKADELFRKVLEVNPESPAALDELLFVHSDPNGTGPNFATLKSLYDANPNSANFASAYGRALLDQGRPQEAISHLRKAAENPRHAQSALSTLATAYQQTGDNRNSADTFARLVSMQEGYLVEAQKKNYDTSDLEQQIVTNQIQQASALIGDKQADRAESVLQAAAQRSPNNPEIEALLRRLRNTR